LIQINSDDDFQARIKNNTFNESKGLAKESYTVYVHEQTFKRLKTGNPRITQKTRKKQNLICGFYLRSLRYLRTSL